MCYRHFTLTPAAAHLQEMGDVEEAHNSFSTAIMLCSALPDGWLSWGNLCDARSRQANGSAWLDHTVTAYLQVHCADLCAEE